MNTTTIDGPLWRRLVMSGAATLNNKRETVNNLNVFPVPDGDTGTNMSMTMTGVLAGNHGGVASVAAYSAAIAKDMMRSARGNSGVILSLFFRGMARAFDGYDTITPAVLLDAVKQGAKAAAAAVEKPVEGTILTVMRECATDITVNEDTYFEQLLDRLHDNAEAVLAKTPEMLPALRRARVVDSGGYGFCRILEGMKRAIFGEETANTAVDEAEVRPAADFEAFSTEEITFAFCTECLVDLHRQLSDKTAAKLKKTLSAMGDSMVFTYDEEILKLHIHTDEPLKVLAMIFPLGALRASKIENMKLQHTGLIEAAEQAPEQPKKPYGIFAVSPGDGFSDVFKELGADGIIAGGQSMNPSAEDILDAIKQCPCETAIVLPNNSNIIMAARQAAELASGTNVIVIPTKTLPQGISALFAFNEAREPEENAEEMTEAASAVTTLSFTRAVRDAEVDGKKVKERQVLGLQDGQVKSAEESYADAVTSMIPLISDRELITLYYGQGVKEDAAEDMEQLLADAFGNSAEVSVVYGGQPLYPFIISAE